MISLLDIEILALVALNLVAVSLFLILELRLLKGPQPARTTAKRKSRKKRGRRRQDAAKVSRKARDRQVEALLQQVELAGNEDRIEKSRRSDAGRSLPDAAESGRTSPGKSFLGSLV